MEQITSKTQEAYARAGEQATEALNNCGELYIIMLTIALNNCDEPL